MKRAEFESKKRVRSISAGSIFLKEMEKNASLYLMCVPGILTLFVFSYIPLAGITMAFKDGKTIRGFFGGNWVGFRNFEFFFRSNDAVRVVSNTLIMNSVFIITITFFALLFAVLLNELQSRTSIKLYQSIMFLPFFLSWVVMGFLAFSFLSMEYGYLNRILMSLWLEPIQWYNEPERWPMILTIVNVLKNAGYYSIVYYAGIMGIDQEMYEAAKIDGASRFRQIINITLPQIVPLISIMVLLQIGKIFYADFGLFYYIPRESGVLFPKTDVIDTYVYRSLRVMGNTGMSAAVGLFQSVVGFVLVVTSNWVTKKINPENALF